VRLLQWYEFQTPNIVSQHKYVYGLTNINILRLFVAASTTNNYVKM
jgi:hypothetical protein